MLVAELLRRGHRINYDLFNSLACHALFHREHGNKDRAGPDCGG